MTAAVTGVRGLVSSPPGYAVAGGRGAGVQVRPC